MKKVSQKSVELVTSVVGRTAKVTMGRSEIDFKQEVAAAPEGTTYAEKLNCLRINRVGWQRSGATGEIVAAYMKDGEPMALIEDEVSGEVFATFLTHCILKPMNRG